MRKMKKISPEISAKVMFMSDRTCCVCRKPGKPVQIHHINGNKNNNILSNLAVLCLDCHRETQIKGGFCRSLTSEQIILYRDDWYNNVSQKRIAMELKEKRKPNDLFFKQITTELDVLKEKRQYSLMAMLYNVIGNTKLRDKYVELAIKRGVSDNTYIYLRKIQNRIDLIPEKIIKSCLEKQRDNKDWSQLARTYSSLKDFKNSLKYYCQSIIEDLDRGNVFSAAFYTKEISKHKLYIPLFEEEYKKRLKNADLWWQIRCLQELGWEDEVHDLLLKNKKIIENSSDVFLKELLYRHIEDEEKLLQNAKEKAESMRLVLHKSNKRNKK